MAECIVQLPGGLLHENRLHRQAVFRPISGDMELLFLEAWTKERSRPRYVTEVLIAALDNIGGLRIQEDPSVVDRICVADRQYLMLQLASMLESDLLWMSSTCLACNRDYDLSVRRSGLPVKEAGPGYPFAAIRLDGAELTCRIPIGEDQERIASLSDNDALHLLLEHCIEEVNKKPPEEGFVDSLSRDDIALIEEVMEDIAPCVTTRLLTRCPECDARQIVELDPYMLPQTEMDEFYQEIHRIAMTYHWSEQDILALPRSRRRKYLDLIDRSRGMYG